MEEVDYEEDDVEDTQVDSSHRTLQEIYTIEENDEHESDVDTQRHPALRNSLQALATQHDLLNLS